MRSVVIVRVFVSRVYLPTYLLYHRRCRSESNDILLRIDVPRKFFSEMNSFIALCGIIILMAIVVSSSKRDDRTIQFSAIVSATIQFEKFRKKKKKNSLHSRFIVTVTVVRCSHIQRIHTSTTNGLAVLQRYRQLVRIKCTFWAEICVHDAIDYCRPMDSTQIQICKFAVAHGNVH